MTVLLLARDLNPSADHLVGALTELGVPVFRTDLAAFPQTLSLDARLGPSGWEGVLATEHRELRLKDIRSVWYRHPSHFVLPEGMSRTERRHAAAEQPGWSVRVVGGGRGVADHRGAGRPLGERSWTVRSEVIELTLEEQDYARSRLAQLAEQFRADGMLRSPQWEQVFRRTWRHPYVPCYYLDHGAGPLISFADEQHRSQWLAAVYSDQSLVTKMVPTPTRKAGWYTSSSTMPSLMLTMLQALDLTDGARVLEIGTGSGYQAAMLCERLGSDSVLSIDIDPELVELARARLAAGGYIPILAAVDGAGGYPDHAPYDRIIATCSVPAIPLAWLEQVVPSGIIMADVRGPLGGTVVRLSATGDGTATGRFLPRYLSFMIMRPGPDTFFPAGTSSAREHERFDQHRGSDPAVPGRVYQLYHAMAPSGGDPPARRRCGWSTRHPA